MEINVELNNPRLIEVGTPYKIQYTNIDYRRNDKNYIDGIHKAIYDSLDQDIINLLKQQHTNATVSGYMPWNKSNFDTTRGSFGIAKTMDNINRNLADAVLERAKLYCPVDTGNLRDSGHIEVYADGTYKVVFSADYAWFVHEFTWRNINTAINPYARAKFLEIAFNEVMKEAGLL